MKNQSFSFEAIAKLRRVGALADANMLELPILNPSAGAPTGQCMGFAITRFMSRVAACVAVTLLAFSSAADQALFWTFQDAAVKTYEGTTVHAKDLKLGDMGVNAIRVKAIDGAASTYLALYDGIGPDVESFGNIRALDADTNWIVDPLFAGFGEGYAKEGVKFVIELGNWNLDIEDFDDDSAWSVLASSSLTDYSSLLRAQYIQDLSAQDITPKGPWNGGSFVVPEPTGGMLTLLGLMMLALRRRV